MLNNGILRALETGMQLLQLRDLLPEGISSNKSLKLEYGGPLMSPDENLKQVTMISMLLKMGVPASEVVPLMPFDPKDIASLEACMVEQNALLLGFKGQRERTKNASDFTPD